MHGLTTKSTLYTILLAWLQQVTETERHDIQTCYKLDIFHKLRHTSYSFDNQLKILTTEQALRLDFKLLNYRISCTG